MIVPRAGHLHRRRLAHRRRQVGAVPRGRARAAGQTLAHVHDRRAAERRPSTARSTGRVIAVEVRPGDATAGQSSMFRIAPRRHARSRRCCSPRRTSPTRARPEASPSRSTASRPTATGKAVGRVPAHQPDPGLAAAAAAAHRRRLAARALLQQPRPAARGAHRADARPTRRRGWRGPGAGPARAAPDRRARRWPRSTVEPPDAARQGLRLTWPRRPRPARDRPARLPDSVKTPTVLQMQVTECGAAVAGDGARPLRTLGPARGAARALRRLARRHDRLGPAQGRPRSTGSGQGLLPAARAARRSSASR